MKFLHIFDTRMMAELATDILTNKVQETFNKYGSVTVADMYEFVCDITGIIDFLDVSYIDHKYGWTEDPHIYVIRTRGWSDANYGLELSDPKLLENVGT